MPQHVADVEKALAAVTGKRRAVLAEVGDVIHPHDQPLVLGLDDVAATGVLDGPKIAGEDHLLLVRDELSVEGEHGVPVHAGLDGRHRFRRQGLAEVHACDFTDKGWVDLANREWHDVVLGPSGTFPEYPRRH